MTTPNTKATLNATIAIMWRKKKGAEAMVAAVSIFHVHYKPVNGQKTKLDASGKSALKTYLGNSEPRVDDFIAMKGWVNANFQRSIEELNSYEQEMKGEFRTDSLFSYKVETAPNKVKMDLIRMYMNQAAQQSCVIYKQGMDVDKFKISQCKMGVIKNLLYPLSLEENKVQTAELSKRASTMLGNLSEDGDEFYNLVISVRDKAFSLDRYLQSIVGAVRAKAPGPRNERQEKVEAVIRAFNSDVSNKLIQSKIAICLASLAPDRDDSVKGKAKDDATHVLWPLVEFIKPGKDAWIFSKPLIQNDVLVGFVGYKKSDEDLEEGPQRRSAPLTQVVGMLLSGQAGFSTGVKIIRAGAKLHITPSTNAKVYIVDDLLKVEKTSVQLNMHLLDYKKEELAAKVSENWIGEKPEPRTFLFSKMKTANVDTGFKAVIEADKEKAAAIAAEAKLKSDQVVNS
jgi:hypothetical protein